jgi:regulator of replication initiation timing
MTDYMQGDHDKSVAVVPFSDDEAPEKAEELLTEDERPDASPEERIQRRTRRNERITNILKEGKKNAEENERLRAEQEALKMQLAEIRGQLSATRSQPATQPARDPYQERLAAVYAKQREAYRTAQAEIKANTWSPEREAYYEQVAQDIETEKASIHAERVVDRRSHASRAEQAQQAWVQKYPEVYQNPRAYQFAEASFRRRQALLEPGAPITNEMVEEAMEEARAQFKLGPKKAPSASERSRLSGVPSAGGGGSSAPAGVQMTPLLRNLATAAYSDLPEAEAIKAWANKEGKRLREKKIL